MNDSVAASDIQPRSVDAGRGLSWWTEAWPLFTKAAGMWIVLTLIFIVLLVVVGIIPLLGGFAISLTMPVFGGGLLLAARKVDGGGTLEVGDLFAGFKDKLSSLLVLGALVMVGGLVIGGAGAMLGMGAMFGIMAGGANNSAGTMLASLGAGMFALLIMLGLGLVLSMAMWFAPALVVFRNVPPVDALKKSFSACMMNIVPFLLFSVLYIAAAIVASIPFGLGWLVLLPVMLLTVYVAYKDVFET